MGDTLVFDLETQFLANEVGGWDRIRDMHLSVGVTYSVVNGVYRVYHEVDVDRLITDLRSADLVVGYNVKRFDYEVLRAYTDDPLSDLPTVDMLVDLYRALGWRPKLDDIAAATIGSGKSANGVQAVQWFREGRIDEVIDYCRQDVEVTWKVYEFGKRNKYVQYRDRSWRVRRVPVRW